MHPDLINLTLAGLAIHLSSYRFFMALAISIAVVGSLWLSKKYGFDIKTIFIILALSVIGFLLGARLLNIIINAGLYIAHPARILSLNTTGFSEYGGLLGGALAGWLASKKLKLDPWRLGDLLAPNLGLGIAIMRIGCYLNGCCFGKTTSLPWGVRFPLFSDAHLYQMSHGITGPFSILPVHPTEIYELIAALIGSTLSWYLLKKKLPAGIPLLAFLLWFTIFRLANHFLRVMPPSFDAPLWFYPALYLVLIAAIALLLIKRLGQNA